MPRATSYAGKRSRVLEVAARLFLERGFDAVSMEAVAATAEVSKVTVYRHFPTKADLLRAVMFAIGGDPANTPPPAGAPVALPLRDRLERVLAMLFELLDREEIVRLGCLIMSQAHRHPDLAREFFANGPALGRSGVTALLQEAMAKGEIELPDPAVAADQLIALVFHRHEVDRNYGARGPAGPGERAAIVARALDAFLRIYPPASRLHR